MSLIQIRIQMLIQTQTLIQIQMLTQTQHEYWHWCIYSSTGTYTASRVSPLHRMYP